LRALRVLAVSGLVLLLLWTIGELVLWIWWPRRWR
jgi:hypothetical protein